MNQEIKNHEDVGKKIAHYNKEGNITVDEKGQRVYIIEGAYLMGDSRSVRWMAYLMKRQDTGEQEQTDWKIFDGNSYDNLYRIMKHNVDKNNDEYKFL